MPEPIIIAHRGASGTYPENTLLAFRSALESGAKWLELDVQLVENRLVVFHDERLERTTNGKGTLSSVTFEHLRQLDAGCGEKVPLLQEVLALASGCAQVNIELKGNGTAVPTAILLAQLFQQESLAPADILASSLRLEELAQFQQLMPEVRRAPIFEDLPGNLSCQLKAFDAWSVHLHKSLITDRVAATARQRGVRVFAWTVNRTEEAGRLIQQGVAGIFTDYPERFLIRGD